MPDKNQKQSFEDLFELMSDLKPGEIETDKLLALCDEDDIIHWVSNDRQAYLLVKIESSEKRDKLIEFIENEIYPHYNDQVKNIVY